MVNYILNYFKSDNNWFKKLLIVPMAIVIVIYICFNSILQMIIYPVFWVIAKILMDNELAADIRYYINKIYSRSYWGF